MNVDQRKAEFQRFIRLNIDQMLAITDKDEQAKYIVGAVEVFFTQIEPKMKDVSDAEVSLDEPPVIDLTAQAGLS